MTTAAAQVAALVAVLACAACSRRSSSATPAAADDEPAVAPVEVTCEPATALTAAGHLELRGIVGVPPDRSATVAAAVTGRVVAIRVHEGDVVAQGALLATVDDPALTPAVAEGDAAVGAAQAALANAEAARTRARRLVDQGIAPRRDVEDAEAKHATAVADLATAAAHRDLARRQLDRARVVAPIAGVVVHVLRHAGELVDGTAATPLVEIADLATLELRADVPAAELVRVRTGQAAEVALDALPAQPLHATLVAVSPAIDPATALGTVRARLAAPPDGVHLVLGLAGVLRIDVPRTAPGLSVPRTAVRRGEDGAQQVVTCESNVAKGVAVTLGARDGDRVEILSGLTAGQRVVTSHVLGLADGAALAVHGSGSGQGASQGAK